MTPTSVTKTKVRTWCRAAGTNFTLHFDKSRRGKRVDIVLWHDTRKVEVRAIKGDGRTANFREFERQEFEPAVADLDWRDQAAAIARAMADRHFA